MKKVFAIMICVLMLAVLSACGSSERASIAKYSTISSIVLNNLDKLSGAEDGKYYQHSFEGASSDAVYYGYFYSASDEERVPECYTGAPLEKGMTDEGGVYFGEPSDGEDWCYVKRITNGWFYYELHWAQ